MKKLAVSLIILISIAFSFFKVSAHSFSEVYFEDHGSIMLIIDPVNGEITDANNAAVDFYGYSKEQLENMNINQINMLTDEEVKKEMELAVSEKRNHFLFEHRIKDGTIKHVEVYSTFVTTEQGLMLFSIIHDISDKVIAQKSFQRNLIIFHTFMIILIALFIVFIIYTYRLKRQALLSKEKFEALFDNMTEGVALHKIICSRDGKPIDYSFVEINKSYEKITGIKESDVINKTAKEVLINIDADLLGEFGKVALTGKGMTYEKRLDNAGKHYSINVYSPQKEYFVTVYSDISDQVREREKQDEIVSLSYRDQLTNLNNRRFFDEEFSRIDSRKNLPISVAMIDVNGLKLTNDAFGHQKGDELLKAVANCIELNSRDDDVVARIGGDEFVMLLPKTSAEDSKKLVEGIYKSISNVTLNEVIISVSVGCETKESKSEDIYEILKKAEEDMYRKKLSGSKNMRSETIKVILKTLNQSSTMEKEHSEKVSLFCKQIGSMMGLDEESLNKLAVAGLMHDIGKIAIDKSLLDKEGKLTEYEFEDVKRHSEVGYHILKSVDEYSEFAEYALSHHERWDGKGYPMEFKKEEIPLFARIITIADSFEAMVSDRPYRKNLSYKEAIKEIERCSGYQFDPEIVRICKERGWIGFEDEF